MFLNALEVDVDSYLASKRRLYPAPVSEEDVSSSSCKGTVVSAAETTTATGGAAFTIDVDAYILLKRSAAKASGPYRCLRENLVEQGLRKANSFGPAGSDALSTSSEGSSKTLKKKVSQETKKKVSQDAARGRRGLKRMSGLAGVPEQEPVEALVTQGSIIPRSPCDSSTASRQESAASTPRSDILTHPKDGAGLLTLPPKLAAPETKSRPAQKQLHQKQEKVWNLSPDGNLVGWKPLVMLIEDQDCATADMRAADLQHQFGWSALKAQEHVMWEFSSFFPECEPVSMSSLSVAEREASLLVPRWKPDVMCGGKPALTHLRYWMAAMHDTSLREHMETMLEEFPDSFPPLPQVDAAEATQYHIGDDDSWLTSPSE
mmetsp:Transcript_58106/g.138236  ORF Transcript_58106/g.138236 Transcript_58106/m.138236 type:complete len:375 (+) Transcript_58106:75-1199(+)